MKTQQEDLVIDMESDDDKQSLPRAPAEYSSDIAPQLEKHSVIEEVVVEDDDDDVESDVDEKEFKRLTLSWFKVE